MKYTWTVLLKFAYCDQIIFFWIWNYIFQIFSIFHGICQKGSEAIRSTKLAKWSNFWKETFKELSRLWKPEIWVQEESEKANCWKSDENAKKYDKTRKFAILIAEYAEKYDILVRSIAKYEIKYNVFNEILAKYT